MSEGPCGKSWSVNRTRRHDPDEGTGQHDQAEADESAGHQRQSDEGLDDGGHEDGVVSGDDAEGEALDGGRGDVLGRAEAREELQDAEAEEDEAEADAKERNAVALEKAVELAEDGGESRLREVDLTTGTVGDELRHGDSPWSAVGVDSTGA